MPDCFSGMTMPVKNGGIRASYKRALDAYEYRYILPQKDWIRYEDLYIEKRKDKGSHLSLFEIMERDLNSGNIQDYKIRLEGLVVSFKEGDYRIDYCYSTLRDLVALFY